MTPDDRTKRATYLAGTALVALVASPVVQNWRPRPERVDDGEVDQRRDDDTADGGGDGDDRPPHLAEVADEELSLELEPGDEEEDREQPVGRPLADRQVEVKGVRADGEVADRGVDISGGSIGQKEGDDGRAEQERSADGVALRRGVHAAPQLVGSQTARGSGGLGHA